MPARTPSEVVDKFHAAANKGLAAPAMQQRLRQLALESMPMHPAEIDRFVADEIAANERLFKAAGIR
jgi:tripartite-type tricarboxylate transporter receptor subunit TctC